MRDDFEVCVGNAAALGIYASVTNRDRIDARASLVVIRDEGTGDELWLGWDDASHIGQFLLGVGCKHPERSAAAERSSFDVEGADEALEVRIVAKDPRLGAVTVPRKDSTTLSRYVIRAAEAISMIERLDAMDEAPNCESRFPRA